MADKIYEIVTNMENRAKSIGCDTVSYTHLDVYKRQDLFTHIESLSHEQLNEIPVGKLVTRVTNDTNAISMMFTNLLVNLAKNAFVILGILVAMLCLNYALTLMAVSYTHLDVYKRQAFLFMLGCT